MSHSPNVEVDRHCPPDIHEETPAAATDRGRASSEHNLDHPGGDSDSQLSTSSRRRHPRGGRKGRHAAQDDIEPSNHPDDEEDGEDLNNGLHRPSRSKDAHPLTPPLSTNTHNDDPHLDSASPSPSPSPNRQRPRGNRKQKTYRDRAGVEDSAPDEPPRRSERQREPDYPDQEWIDEAERNSKDYDGDQLRKARSSRPSRPSRQKSSANGTAAKPKGSDTGIRAFNVKRAKESGGGRSSRRPFGISVERPQEEPKRRKSKKGGRTEDESESGSEDDGREREEKKKPVSIRLDLNLELEIFLRAKIKGDITITFLE